jgi:hypothetical protein
MDLTEENKNHIDGLSYESLLYKWRFAPIDDPMFQGETGEYFGKRMREMRDQVGDDEHVRASKYIGWED